MSGANISGELTATLTINPVAQSNAGTYTVACEWWRFGPSGQRPAILTVIDPPVITTKPASRTNNAGTEATFTVSVSGTAPFSYQWRRNGTNLVNGTNCIVSGATTATLTIADILKVDEGSYSVVVTNPAGSDTSSNAVLTVIDPAINTPPTNTYVHRREQCHVYGGRGWHPDALLPVAVVRNQCCRGERPVRWRSTIAS